MVAVSFERIRTRLAVVYFQVLRLILDLFPVNLLLARNHQQTTGPPPTTNSYAMYYVTIY